MVSHIEVCLPDKHPTPKNIGECLKGPQRQLCKEALFMQYGKNKKFSIISDPIPIKYLRDGEKFLRSLITPRIKKGDNYYECKCVAHHCVNFSSNIKGIHFDQS